MPNWCSNALGVTGPAEDIASFVEAIKPPDGTPEDENEWDLPRPRPLPDGRASDGSGAEPRSAIAVSRYLRVGPPFSRALTLVTRPGSRAKARPSDGAQYLRA